MAAAASSCMHLFLDNRLSDLRNPWKCPARFRCSFVSRTMNKSSRRDLIPVLATPVTAGDALSSLLQPGAQALSDNPWLSLIAALFVTVPLIQKLLALTKQVDTAAETVLRMGNTVEKVANDVDRAKEDISKGLLDMTSGLKKVVTIVEDLAKESIEDGEKIDEKVDELICKVEELDEKLDKLVANKI